ncbi:hypothetical protein DFR65_101632 [Oceanihabitans sediminis]|nr:hypothetical protein DFR65_101632 [Oceanihabitans sediminis]
MLFFVLIINIFLYIYNTMINRNKNMLASVLFVLISFVCVAQDTPQPPAPAPPPGLPIDSGVYVILVIGLMYGAYKILRFKVNSKA